MARYIGPDLGESGPVPALTPPVKASFDHYDQWGQPIDTNGDVMQGGFGTTWGPPPDAPTAPPEEPSGPEPPPPEPAVVAPPVGAAAPPSAYEPPVYQPPADNPFAPWSGDFTPPPVQSLPDAPVFTPPTYTPPPAFSYDESTPGYVAPPTYAPPPAFSYGDFTAPEFTAPPAFSYGDFQYGDFQGPSIDEAINSPGYQFRLGQGTDRLQNAASARGTLNDSGTLKALMDYGQDAASQEYANVWRRAYDTYGTNRSGAVDEYNLNRGNAVDTYNTNYQTQYADPYKARYQSTLDTYTQNRGNALDTYNTNYQTQFVDPYNVAKDQWTTGRANALDQYKVNYQTQYADPYAHSYQAAQDQFAPQFAGWQTNAQNTQHLNDMSNTNAWNDYLLGFQDYQTRRNLATNFALQS